MKKILPPIAICGLVLTIVPPFLHLVSSLDEKTTFFLMAAGMVIWYCAAVPWLYGKKPKLDESTQDYI